MFGRESAAQVKAKQEETDRAKSNNLTALAKTRPHGTGSDFIASNVASQKLFATKKRDSPDNCRDPTVSDAVAI